MKKIITAIVAGAVLTVGSSFAGNGQQIFQSKGCATCHNPNIDTVGPSLKKIAQAYKGKEDKLIAFLKGEYKAIVDPAKFAIMQPQINATKSLSDADLKALVEFILNH